MKQLTVINESMKNNFSIENEDKLINPLTDEKKLRSIANRIAKANDELIALGYTSYLAAHGSWNIMNGSSHGLHAEPLQENIAGNFQINGIDAGDW